MENPNLNDSKAEVHVEISQNLLEDGIEPEADQTDEDFRQQNEIINQELKKYDGRLNTCLMIMIKVWITCYMTSLSISALRNLINLFSHPPQASILAWALCITNCIETIIIFATEYGCILLWMAINSKDLFKVERCLPIFKLYFIWSMIVTSLEFSLSIYLKMINWRLFLLSLLGFVTPVINLGTALYVKKVLLIRDPFKQVSSC